MFNTTLARRAVCGVAPTCEIGQGRCESCSQNSRSCDICVEPANAADAGAIADHAIPDRFDARESMPEAQRQGDCGSCWAFSVAAALVARFRLAGVAVDDALSAQRLIVCALPPVDCITGAGSAAYTCEELLSTSCDGNSLEEAWVYLRDWGTVRRGCSPYLFGHKRRCEGQPALRSLCTTMYGDAFDECPAAGDDPMDGEVERRPRTMPLYCALRVYALPNHERLIRAEILARGPVTSAMMIFEDWKEAGSFAETGGGPRVAAGHTREHGIYRHRAGSRCVEGHSVVLAGWGSERGIPYWIVQNTWGEAWGDRGYFKLLRGTNECAVEQGVVVGTADVEPFGATPPGPTALDAALENVREYVSSAPTSMPDQYGGTRPTCISQRQFMKIT